MKKELYLDTSVGFLVGVIVGLAIIVLSEIGINLSTGGAYEEPLSILFSQTIPVDFDWVPILKFLLVFGLIFAMLNPLYTYSKVGLRKQLNRSRKKTTTKKQK